MEMLWCCKKDVKRRLFCLSYLQDLIRDLNKILTRIGERFLRKFIVGILKESYKNLVRIL